MRPLLAVADSGREQALCACIVKYVNGAHDSRLNG